jgi:hypothetical protein
MALSTYLLQKNRWNGITNVNGCHAMLHTIDPSVSTTAAARLAAAITLAETAMAVDHLPDNYFDVEEELIGAASGGYLPALGDNIVFTKNAQIITIAT